MRFKVILLLLAGCFVFSIGFIINNVFGKVEEGQVIVVKKWHNTQRHQDTRVGSVNKQDVKDYVESWNIEIQDNNRSYYVQVPKEFYDSIQDRDVFKVKFKLGFFTLKRQGVLINE